MIYDHMTKDYLNGNSFSNGGKIRLDSNNSDLLYRDDYLINIAQDKNILHLGFVDHIPLIDEKIINGSWLHEKLVSASNICYGIDINKEGIEYIKDKYKYDNLYAIDIVSDSIPTEIKEIEFDYIFIPDVIEHIGNPVKFLKTIHNIFKDNIKDIILTTPNAFRLNNFANTLRKIELINTDHRFWFSPYTLSKVVTDAGYNINGMGYFEHSKLSKIRILKNIIVRRRAPFRDTLIIDASFDK